MHAECSITANVSRAAVVANRSPELTYVGAKVLARAAKNKAEGVADPEESAVRYYRVFADSSLRRHLTFMQRASTFHEANKSWIWSAYASAIGLSTITFRSFGIAKRIRRMFSGGDKKTTTSS